MTRCSRLVPLVGCCLLAAFPSPARGYITAPVQTLGQLCGSTYITLVRVDKISKEKGVIIYRKVRDLKGKYPLDVLRHAFDLKNTPQHKGPGDVPIRPDEVDWRYALQWAEVGKTAVVFSLKYDPYGDFGHTYIDKCWYATMCPQRDWDWWYSIYSDPALLTRWHCGTPSQLAVALEQILAGKTAVVPTLAEGTRDDLRKGRGKIQGLKVSLGLGDFDPARDRVPGWVSKEIPALIKDLDHADRQVRLQALRELGNAGPDAKTTVAKLVPLLKDKDEEISLASLDALGRIDPENREILPRAMPLLKHSVPERRIRAAEILTQNAARAKAAGPALLALLQEPDRLDRLRILELLAPTGAGAAEVASAAAAFFEDPEKEIRLRAGATLARIGPAGKPAVPALIKAMKDPDRDLRIQAAETLGLIGSEAKSAVPVLAEVVGNDSSGTVRMRSADALGKLGPDAKAARPALEAALKDPRMAQRPEVMAKISEILATLK